MGSYRKLIIIKNWRTFTGDPEHDALVNSMYALEEREGERHGWDQRPSVWMMHLADVDTGTFRVDPLDRRLWSRGCDNPVDDLMRVAAEVGMPTTLPARTRYADTADGIAAVAFMSEMWGATPDRLSPELVARQNTGERVIHTLPAADRMEMRSIGAVDINGLGSVVLRIRGRDKAEAPTIALPEMMIAPEGDGPGRALRSLFAITTAAREGRWPKR